VSWLLCNDLHLFKNVKSSFATLLTSCDRDLRSNLCSLFAFEFFEFVESRCLTMSDRETDL
jgi:hypothetical protein